MASFHKRTTAGGEFRWRATVRRNGRQIVKSFSSKADAQRWAKYQERRLERRAAGLLDTVKGLTLSDTVELYIDGQGRLKRRIGKTYAATLERFRREIGTMPLTNIDQQWIVNWAMRRRADAAASTVAQDLSVLASILIIGRDLYHFDLDEQLDAIRNARRVLGRHGAIGKARERSRRPTAGELKELFAYWRSNRRVTIPMPDITEFAIATAMRLGEICRVRWDDLNHEKRTVVIRERKHPDLNEKAKRDETVPLLNTTGYDAFAIATRQRRANDRIFPFKPASVSAAWQRACKRTGIEDLHFHDLRHEGLSRLAEASYGVDELAVISGHRDWTMLRRYVQRRPEDLHR